MINIGDTVKVLGGTPVCGTPIDECIPIGTICDVIEIWNCYEGRIIGITPTKEGSYECCGEFWYLEKDLEKGHLEVVYAWVKDDE